MMKTRIPPSVPATMLLGRRPEGAADASTLRVEVDVTPMMALQQDAGPKRACWNSRSAPHNVDGLFLALADMPVKEGDGQTARTIFAAARS